MILRFLHFSYFFVLCTKKYEKCKKRKIISQKKDTPSARTEAGK